MNCIYVAEREDGLCKVGWCENPFRRMKQLNRDYWIDHSLIRYWEREDAYQIEQLIHSALVEFCAIGREVYRISSEEMQDVINGVLYLIDRYEIKLRYPVRKKRKDAKN